MALKKKVLPRRVPNRDERYMGLAHWMASFSKDPNTQMGAIIVTSDNRPLGWGYNGPPRLIRDADINWDRPDKYDYIVHAEENAIDHCLRSPKGSTLYVTGLPCKKCMLKIIHYEIRRVIWFPHKSADHSSMLANEEQITTTEELARLATPVISLEKFYGNLNWMRDRIIFMESIGVFD